MDDITLRQMQSIAPAAAPMRREGASATTTGGPSFDEVLRERLASPGAPTAPPAPIKFSAHAQTRLQSRNIPFGPEETARLEAAIGKAQAKGARDSLVLMDGVALVVSVKNRTVITAVDAASLKENVFTNIDSAVIC
jgi:flagellar operon protein